MAVTSMSKSTIRNFGKRNTMKFPSVELSGGTVTSTNVDGTNYRVHTFTSSDTMGVIVGGLVEYLVVGGGGGGGCQTSSDNRGGGGAGAGGLLDGSVELEQGDITITVGSGGNGAASYDTVGTKGGDSSIGTLVVADGGGFGGSAGNAPGSGGSGGGGGHTAGASGIAGQGFAGGAGSGTPSTTGGAGGGSSAAGANFAAGQGPRPGGAGTSNSITGTAYTYARGGDAWYGTAVPNVQDKYGDGGNSTTLGTVTDGQDGVVIVRYVV